MKQLIRGILGCALAVAVATFATTPAKAAGTVIENTLYTPLDITFVVQYVDGKGHVQNYTANSKAVLKFLGYPSSDQLATDYDGNGDSADVFVISKNAVIDDLTQDGDIFDINFDDLVQKTDKSGKNGSFSESERGVFSMTFNSGNIIASGIAANAQINPNDTYFFEAQGVYTWTESGGTIKNNGDQKISTDLNVIRVIGDGSDTSNAPTIKANIQSAVGDFLIKNGGITGSGDGTVEVE